MALVLPIRIPNPPPGRGELLLVIILDAENMRLMTEFGGGNPFDMQVSAYGKVFNLQEPVGKLDIVIAYEKDIAKVVAFAKSRNVAGLLDYIERNRVNQPEDGTPPISLLDKTN